MKILYPTPITPAMIKSGTTIAEPATGETAWASGGTYALGDFRLSLTAHRIYKCAQAHSGRTAYPENDTAYWTDFAPSQRAAPFDYYTSTKSSLAGNQTWVIQPGFFNAIGLYGFEGNTVQITVKDAPGGTVIFSKTLSMLAPPSGWYQYLFGPRRTLKKLLVTDIPPRPNAELSITLTGNPTAIGSILVGDYRSLIGDAEWGGTEAGATAEPVTFSYIKQDPDYGTVKIVRRPSATGMRASVVLPRSQADAAIETIQALQDQVVAWVASDQPGFDGLHVVGLGSASVAYRNQIATISLTVKGMI